MAKRDDTIDVGSSLKSWFPGTKSDKFVQINEAIVDKMMAETEEFHKSTVLVQRRDSAWNSSPKSLHEYGLMEGKLTTGNPYISKRRQPPSLEEKREMERVKKARWRAKKRDKDSDSHHFDIPFTALPKCIWDQIKRDFFIYSNGTADEEGLALLVLLNSIGFEWDSNGNFFRVPDVNIFQRIRDLAEL